MKIGDEVFVHGYIDEIRKDTVIIRNDGGYFGTVPDEIKKDLSETEIYNLLNDLEKGDDLLTDDDLRLLINDAIKEKKAEQDKVTQWIKDNADFIKEMTRMLEDGRIQG